MLLGDSPRAFADAVLRLLRDQLEAGTLATNLGQRARLFVEANYSWHEIVPKLEDALLRQTTTKQAK